MADEYEDHLAQYEEAVDRLEKWTARYNESHQKFADASGQLVEANGKTESLNAAIDRAKLAVDEMAPLREADAAGKKLEPGTIDVMARAELEFTAARKARQDHSFVVHRLENEVRVLEARVDHAGREMEIAQRKVVAARALVEAHDDEPDDLEPDDEEEPAEPAFSNVGMLTAGDVRTEDTWFERPSILGSVSGKIPVCPNVEEHGLDGM